jgi:hypothetical protein
VALNKTLRRRLFPDRLLHRVAALNWSRHHILGEEFAAPHSVKMAVQISQKGWR